MGLYNKYILPKVIHYTCRQKPAMKQREKVVPAALGNVLEIGIGSGLGQLDSIERTFAGHRHAAVVRAAAHGEANPPAGTQQLNGRSQPLA